MSAKWILALPLALTVASAFADDGLRVGILAGAGYDRITDPAGPTHTSYAPDIGLIAITDWARDARLLYQGHYQRFTLNAGTHNIGQDVKRVGVSASYQHLLRLTHVWKPWLGLGVGYTHETQSARHTIDRGGFLASTYPDRSDSELSALFTASSEWRRTQDLNLGFTLQYDAPLSASSTSVVTLDFEADYALR
ncbi:MAG: hypothetical protein ACYDDO_04715 [Acidiferrobacterales bacterium]